MLTANVALAKLANYKRLMGKQSKQVKGRMAALRAVVYDAAVIVNDQTNNNTSEFIAKIKSAFPGRADCVDAFLEDTFRIYSEFDGDYRTALRSVEMGATKKEFIAAPFTAAFKNPLPKRKPDGRTTKARLDILDDVEDVETRLADPKQRPVAFIAHDHDDEPRVTPTKQERAYNTQKELEQELALAYATIAAMKKTDAAKDQLIAAQADEITSLKLKLKGRAA